MKLSDYLAIIEDVKEDEYFTLKGRRNKILASLRKQMSDFCSGFGLKERDINITFRYMPKKEYLGIFLKRSDGKDYHLFFETDELDIYESRAIFELRLKLLEELEKIRLPEEKWI